VYVYLPEYLSVGLLTSALADEWKNDPRNPTLKNKVGAAH
jgi:hypothetical protein